MSSEFLATGGTVATTVSIAGRQVFTLSANQKVTVKDIIIYLSVLHKFIEQKPL